MKSDFLKYTTASLLSILLSSTDVIASTLGLCEDTTSAKRLRHIQADTRNTRHCTGVSDPSKSAEKKTVAAWFYIEQAINTSNPAERENLIQKSRKSYTEALQQTSNLSAKAKAYAGFAHGRLGQYTSSLVEQKDCFQQSAWLFMQALYQDPTLPTQIKTYAIFTYRMLADLMQATGTQGSSQQMTHLREAADVIEKELTLKYVSRATSSSSR